MKRGPKPKVTPEVQSIRNHVRAAARSSTDRELAMFLLGALEAVKFAPPFQKRGLDDVLEIGRAHLFPEQAEMIQFVIPLAGEQEGAGRA